MILAAILMELIATLQSFRLSNGYARKQLLQPYLIVVENQHTAVYIAVSRDKGLKKHGCFTYKRHFTAY